MKRIRALAALGAAVFTPLLPAFAQGTIVYVDPPDVVVGAREETVSFDLNSDGVTDVDFRYRSADFQVLPRDGNQVSAVPAVAPEAGGYAVPVALGALVSASTPWQPRYPYPPFLPGEFYGPQLSTTAGTLTAYGPFAGLDGYLGIRFLIGGNLHYGWIHLNCIFTGPFQPAAGRITEWAYNAVPNEPLAAGVVPEPRTWALLALGAAALWILRRRPS